MRIQVVDSATGEVIFTPSSNATLERELHDFLDELAASRRWWQSKKHLVAAKQAITDVAAELRRGTLA